MALRAFSSNNNSNILLHKALSAPSFGCYWKQLVGSSLRVRSRSALFNKNLSGARARARWAQLLSKTLITIHTILYTSLRFTNSKICMRIEETQVLRNLSHSMMSWNLTSKKFPTETEYGVWKLLSCSFTYQSQKIRFRSPCEKNHKNSLSKWKFFVHFVISLSKARFCDFSHRGYGIGFF